MSTPEIHRFVVISTGHLTEGTARFLDTTPAKNWPYAGGPYADYGWFFYAHDENLNTGSGAIPDDLFAVMTWARKQVCHYLLLDCDGDAVDDLPQFDW